VLPGSFDSYHDYSVKIATKSETELLVELYKQFEYRKKKRSADEAKREIENVMKESGIFFMAVVDGRAVSAAKIATETDKAGIIGSARTLPEYRGRGIYLSVRTACFEYLFDKGKIGVGFFEDKNVNIHKILKKQGGFISNKWLIINFGRKQRTARRRFISLFLRQRSLNIFDRVLNRQN
jgi:predicted GNAT family acetyltransferase